MDAFPDAAKEYDCNQKLAVRSCYELGASEEIIALLEKANPASHHMMFGDGRLITEI